MNRADLIKLVSHQLQEEVAHAKKVTLEELRVAERAFHAAIEDLARRKNNAQNLYMLHHTRGDERVKIDIVVHYQLNHDELASPRDHCKVTFRDGTPWEQSYEFTVRQDFSGEILALRNEWIKAQKDYMAALSAGERMTDVKQEAWKRVVDAALDDTSAGAAVKVAVAELRKELKRDGFAAIAKKLGE